MIIFFAVAMTVAFWAPNDKPYTMSDGSTQNPATLTDLIASCKGVVDWQTAPSAYVGWLPEGATHRYPIFPPTSGTFSALAAKPGIYDLGSKTAPAIPQAMGSLWRGAVVIWYKPDLDVKKKESLFQFAKAEPGGGKFIVAPWPNNKSNNWSSSDAIVLTAWGMSQACDVASYDVMDAFAKRIASRPAPGNNVPYTTPGPKLG